MDKYDPWWRADAGPPVKKDKKILINLLWFAKQIFKKLKRRKKNVSG